MKKHAVCFKDLMLKLPIYSFLFPGVTQYPTPSFEKVWSVTTRNTSVQSITDSMTSMSTYPSPKTQRSTLSTLLQKSHLWSTHSSTQPRDFKSDSKKLLFFLWCICLSRLLKHYESLWAIIYFIEMTWSLIATWNSSKIGIQSIFTVAPWLTNQILMLCWANFSIVAELKRSLEWKTWV